MREAGKGGIIGGMLDLYEEFLGVVETLERGRVPYAVCGGLAVAIHTQPRATVDIDLLVPEEAVESVIAAVKPLAFEETAFPMTFSEGQVRIRRLTKLEAGGPDFLVLDLLIAQAEGLLRQVWAARGQVAWAQDKVTVVSRDGLIALKRLRNSPQDLADIQALEHPEGP